MKHAFRFQFLVVLLALFSAAPAFAVREYYALSRSVRAMGMGGAFYTLSDDDYALFYNPAGLSLVKDHRFNVIALNAHAAPDVFSAISTLTSGTNKDIGNIADSLSKFQGETLSGSAGMSLFSFYKKHFAFALIVPETKLNFAFLGRDISTQVDVTAIADAGILVGYGTDFMNEKLHVGMTAKALVRGGGRRLFTLADIASKDQFTIDPQKLGGVGAGIDFDLGAIYELPVKPIGPLLNTRVSMTLNNLLAPTFNMIHITGGKPPGTNRMLTFGGAAILKGYGPIDNINVLLDFAEFSMGGESDPELGSRGGSFWKHVNFGVEAPIKGIFIPRLGVHQGYFTAGFGLDLRVLRLDFATYAEELAAGVDRRASRRIALRLQLGWGAPNAPVAAKTDVDKKDGAVPVAPPVTAPGTPPGTVPPVTPAPPAGAGKPGDIPQLQEEKGAPKIEGPATAPAAPATPPAAPAAPAAPAVPAPEAATPPGGTYQ